MCEMLGAALERPVRPTKYDSEPFWCVSLPAILRARIPSESQALKFSKIKTG
jgi:hypothetical protein